MDGGHRVVRAWLDGKTEIDAVRFPEDPEPDIRRPRNLPHPGRARRTGWG